MAETRKFNPAAGDPIADAIRAALGEPVRPRVPGENKDADAPPTQPKRPQVTTIGSFTFASPNAPRRDA